MFSKISQSESSRNTIDEPFGRSSRSRGEKSMPTVIFTKILLYTLCLVALFTPVKAGKSNSRLDNPKERMQRERRQKYIQKKNYKNRIRDMRRGYKTKKLSALHTDYYPCQEDLYKWKQIGGKRIRTKEKCENRLRYLNQPMCDECQKKQDKKKAELAAMKEQDKQLEAKRLREIAINETKIAEAIRAGQDAVYDKWFVDAQVLIDLNAEGHEQFKEKMDRIHAYGTGKIKKIIKMKFRRTQTEVFYVKVALDVYRKDGKTKDPTKKVNSLFMMNDTKIIRTLSEVFFSKEDAIKDAKGVEYFIQQYAEVNTSQVEKKDWDSYFDDFVDDVEWYQCNSDEASSPEEVHVSSSPEDPNDVLDELAKTLASSPEDPNDVLDELAKTVNIDSGSGSSEQYDKIRGEQPLGSVPTVPDRSDRSERRRMLVNRLIAAEMN